MTTQIYRFLMIVLLLVAAGCATNNMQAMRESLLDTDKQWSIAVAGHDVDDIAGYWTDDAEVYAAGRPPVIGKQALRAFVSRNRSIPGFSLTWEASKATVSRSGDLGYTLGPYELTVPGPNGDLMTQKGQYICVWRREGEAWRCELEVHAPYSSPGKSTP